LFNYLNNLRKNFSPPSLVT